MRCTHEVSDWLVGKKEAEKSRDSGQEDEGKFRGSAPSNGNHACNVLCCGSTFRAIFSYCFHRPPVTRGKMAPSSAPVMPHTALPV